MKKCLIMAFAMFAFCNLDLRANYIPDSYLSSNASSVANTAIVANTSGPKSEGFMVLTDGHHPTYWQVFSFIPRTRGLSEWWNNVKLAPDSWKCLPSDWTVGSGVSLVFKAGNLDFSEDDAYNRDELRMCTHILTNQANGQRLLARHMGIGPFLEAIYQYADSYGQDRGYSEGLRIGREQVSVDRRKLFQEGVMEGIREGYKEGYDVGFTDAYNGKKYDSARKAK